ncbi:hypothetical protein KBY97_05385 [Synechococcus sp. ATX 2A4]|uniref:hypothetical protein n=1 Tax=Synechococcus sp. ATX 2A4 TaxID=2823727 RepID=UPI0020CEBF2E|nr:hypothetical protein [Synechococcus sp. ATX 2A4]MCP9884557.1 hypothetical protein [Synechococcus sp. ATX 2A4]
MPPPPGPSDLPAGDAPEGERDDRTPPIPATAPLLGPDGTLLYTGSDGMQYIVCGEPDAEERARLLGAFEALRSGAGPLEELIKTSRAWRDAACTRGLSPKQATEVLLGRLRQALSDSPDPSDGFG